MRTPDLNLTVVVVILALVVVLAIIALVVIFGLGEDNPPTPIPTITNSPRSTDTLTPTETPIPPPLTQTAESAQNSAVETYVAERAIPATIESQFLIETATADAFIEDINLTNAIENTEEVEATADITMPSPTRFVTSTPLNIPAIRETGIATYQLTQPPPPTPIPQPSDDNPPPQLPPTPTTAPTEGIVPINQVGILNWDENLYVAPSDLSGIEHNLAIGTLVDISLSFSDWYYVNVRDDNMAGWTLQSNVSVLDDNAINLPPDELEATIVQRQTQIVMTATNIAPTNDRRTIEAIGNRTLTATRLVFIVNSQSQEVTPRPTNTPTPNITTSRTETYTPTPTITLTPSATPTLTNTRSVTNTYTPSPTNTPTNTSAPPSQCILTVIASQGVNVRTYPVYGNTIGGGLANGQQQVVSRRITGAPSGIWYRVSSGWVIGNGVSLTGNCNNLPTDIYQPPPISPTPTFTNTPVINGETPTVCTNYGVTSPSGGSFVYTFDAYVCAPVGTTPTLILTVNGLDFYWALDPVDPANGIWGRAGVTLGESPESSCGDTFLLSVDVVAGGLTPTVTKDPC